MIRKAVPSFITSLGLIAGCISIVFSLSGNLYFAGIMILAAALFDFLDGLSARIWDSISEFGIQMDSLADMVSFGVAPAMIIKQLMQFSLVASAPGSSFDIQSPGLMETVMMYAAFLIAVFSALRLARFNLDKGQVNDFKGLPTPANALLIAALGFSSEKSQPLIPDKLIFNQWFLLVFILLSCFLLVSNIRMFSLKFKTYGYRENSIRYVFLAASVFLLVYFGLQALSLIILLYVLLSLFLFIKVKRNPDGKKGNDYDNGPTEQYKY
ncbi:MAG: CDP-alcohol phosphatidyltransferase family protein [Bacteroidales bacterium]|nr:CDP-alcohol phosphatidyltransferase family protein [Bacteroidales bacterium]